MRVRGWDLGWLGAIIAVLLVAGVIGYALARGGGPTDEQAVRNWFATPAGGTAPASAITAIHVGTCMFTDAESDKRAVMGVR